MLAVCLSCRPSPRCDIKPYRMTYEQVDEAKAVGASKADSKAGAARGVSVVPTKAAVGASKAGDARGVAVLPAKATVAKFATPNLRVFFAAFSSWFYVLLSLLFYFAVCSLACA